VLGKHTRIGSHWFTAAQRVAIMRAHSAVDYLRMIVQMRLKAVLISETYTFKCNKHKLCFTPILHATHLHDNTQGPCGLPTFETADPSILAPLGATIADPSILDPLAWHNSGQGNH
jgi:hypothetical protein